jgi:A-kinase anchor protein 14
MEGISSREPTKFAEFIANEAIEAAVSHFTNDFNQQSGNAISVFKNIKWMTIGEFDVDAATEKIKEFINETWDLSDYWLYCVDYMGAEQREFVVAHMFRARFSIPTRRLPIPRATASVYFTFGVSKIKPPETDIDVSYVFEGSRLIHRPGESKFREQWLSDILESKAAVMRQVNF